MLRWDGGDAMQPPLASHIDALMRKLQKQVSVAPLCWSGQDEEGRRRRGEGGG